MFHLVSKKIRNDAKKFRIEHETFNQFARRCKKTLREFPTYIIDNTIASMDKRIQLVIDAKGQRIKY